MQSQPQQASSLNLTSSGCRMRIEENSVRKFKFIFLLGVFVMAVSTLGVTAKAQIPSDPSFVKICDLYGSADQGNPAWNKDDSCALPVGFALDKSYRQAAFNCCGGGATSNIGVADIPAGIHIVVDGGYYWSVVKPIELIRLDEDGPPKRVFRIHTYCGPGAAGQGGCNVKVAVYAKRLP